MERSSGAKVPHLRSISSSAPCNTFPMAVSAASGTIGATFVNIARPSSLKECATSRVGTLPIVSQLSADARSAFPDSQTYENVKNFGRGDWIRTSDPLRPRQALERFRSADSRMICGACERGCDQFCDHPNGDAPLLTASDGKRRLIVIKHSRFEATSEATSIGIRR